MSSRIHSRAQPSDFSEEESVQGSYSQGREPSSNDLSQEDQAASNHSDSRTRESPSKVENGKSQKLKATLGQLKPKTNRQQLSELVETLSLREHTPHLGERWKIFQGCDGWEGLLEPLDSQLRAEMYRYGRLAQATYAAFDKKNNSTECGCESTQDSKVANSRHCGSKYTKEKLLEMVGLKNLGYKITKFLYNTSKLSKLQVLGVRSRRDFIGFVAECTSRQEIRRLGRKDIVVAFRGTVTSNEWIKDSQFWPKPIATVHKGVKGQSSSSQFAADNKGVKVESGFLSVYKSTRDEVLKEVEALVNTSRKENTELSITVTGHSLGSALATLCAYDIAHSNWITHSKQESSATQSETESSKLRFLSHQIPITVYSFSGPLVGNRAFRERIERPGCRAGVAVLRVFNKNDIVTKCPGVSPLINLLLEPYIPSVSLPSYYKHVGVKYDVTALPSPTKETPETQSKKPVAVTPKGPEDLRTQESMETTPEEIMDEPTDRNYSPRETTEPNHNDERPGIFHWRKTFRRVKSNHSLTLILETIDPHDVLAALEEILPRATYLATIFIVKLRNRVRRLIVSQTRETEAIPTFRPPHEV